MGVNNDGTLRYDTKVDRSGFKKGLAEIKKDALKDSAAVVSSFNKTAKAIALSAASIGAGIVAVGVKYNAQMEQYNAGFTTMLGSAEKAQKLMGDLKGFAAKTPFELTDLANASTTLLAFGEDVEQLMPDLKMLGDISLGNAEKFKGLALVFGQVQSQGRLMGQDLLQMINQGFNPLQIISEKTGKSVATLKDEMAKGQITFEMVADAMKTATSEGGQFYNAMATQSKILTGQWSTLKDNVIALTGEISSDISEELTESVLPKLISKVEELNQMWEEGRLQDYIGTATAALVTFGTAIAALNVILFVNDMAQLTSGVKNYTTATKAGAAAQKLMNAELLKNPYTLALTAVLALTAGIITYAATHKSTATEIVESLEEMSEAYQDSVEDIDKRARAEAAEAQTALVLKDKLFELEEQINSGKLSDESATKAKEEFGKVADDLNEIIPGIIESIYDENGAIPLSMFGECAEVPDIIAMVEARPELLLESVKNRIDGYCKLNYANKEKRDRCIKDAITRYNGKDKKVAVPSTSSKFFGANHAIILTGWDDDNDTWIFQNSQGRSYGNNGRKEIPREKVDYAYAGFKNPIILPFEDVPEDDYGFDAIKNMFLADIAKGISDTKFNPDGFVTRRDMMIIIDRALSKVDKVIAQNHRIEYEAEN